MKTSSSRMRRHRNPQQNADVRNESSEHAAPFFSNGTVQTKKDGAFFQPKLTIGKADDPYEREADAVADTVVNKTNGQPPFPNNSGFRSSTVQTKEISTIQRLATPEEEKMPATNDGRMAEDKRIQEKPMVQKMEAPKEEEEPAIQKMEAPKEEEKPAVQKMEAPKEEEKEAPSVQKLEKPEEEEPVQTKSEKGGSHTTSSAFTAKIGQQQGRGNRLPEGTKARMESGFGRDFSNVTIHTDTASVALNQDIGAQAFTHGKDIYFNSGKFQPENREGAHLLAHELTHVVQQNGETIQRKTDDRSDVDTPKTINENKATDKAAVKKPWVSSNPDCPSDFCTPFPLPKFAVEAMKNEAMPALLLGIGIKVNPRVVPLWQTYLNGGSPPQNFTKVFGKDFTDSLTTQSTTAFLVSTLKKKLATMPFLLPAGQNTVTIPLADLIPSEINEISVSGGANEMDFNVISEIPGNIAGGIGKDQKANPIGAQPSPFDDARLADGHVRINKAVDGSLEVVPTINYMVKDTIDLCPGNCGSSAGMINEQLATVPMSRFEASGVSGDVPFSVDFAAKTSPFKMDAVKKPTGLVTASMLYIRQAATKDSAMLGHFMKGESIEILSSVKGMNIEGNAIWYLTNRGYVSAAYVSGGA